MERNGQRYCNRCFLLIAPAEKFVAVKIYGTKDEYYHYHNRERGDCYGKQIAEAVNANRLQVLRSA